MEYKIEKKDDVHIDVTIPWSDAQKEFDKLVEQAIKRVVVKGFRKGAVPRDIAEARVDRSQILADAADHLLRHHYPEIIRKETLRVVGAPRVSVTKLAENNDIEVKIVAMVLPEIVLPKNWKDAVKKVNKESTKDQSGVTDEDVMAELEHIAAGRATHNAVERAAQSGDHVKIDFTVKQDGVVIENGTSRDHSLVLGKGVFIPGFEEHVIGMNKGDEKTFELSFPEEYHAKHLAGKKASFDVKLNVVEERVAPVIDDAFATSLGEQFKNLDELKKSIKEGMEKEHEKKVVEERRAKQLDALADLLDVSLPQPVVDDELTRMVGEFEQQISMSGLTIETYLEKIGKTRDELTTEWTPQARKRVISALVLEQLAEDEDVKVDNVEVEAELNRTLAMYKGMKDLEKNIDMRQLYEYAKGMLRNNKVFEILEKL